MKAGVYGRAPTLDMASSSVASGFGFGACLKPMWLSEICRKVNPLPACAFASEIPSSDDRGTPPAIVHSTPVSTADHAFQAPQRPLRFSAARTGATPRRPNPMQAPATRLSQFFPDPRYANVVADRLCQARSSRRFRQEPRRFHFIGEDLNEGGWRRADQRCLACGSRRVLVPGLAPCAA
jgi:hypothetical protein